MAWFHPKSLLDKTYEIGLLIKGIDGVFELAGGLLLWLIPRDTVSRLTKALTQNQLDKNPHDVIANHILHLGQSLAHGRNWFAIAFLLSHGIIKIALVAALLRNKLWAYPWALVVLTLFLIYQVYAFIIKPGFGMGFLSVLDVLIIWLVWREWHKVEPKPQSQSSAVN